MGAGVHVCHLAIYSNVSSVFALNPEHSLKTRTVLPQLNLFHIVTYIFYTTSDWKVHQQFPITMINENKLEKKKYKRPPCSLQIRFWYSCRCTQETTEETRAGNDHLITGEKQNTVLFVTSDSIDDYTILT